MNSIRNNQLVKASVLVSLLGQLSECLSAQRNVAEKRRSAAHCELRVM